MSSDSTVLTHQMVREILPHRCPMLRIYSATVSNNGGTPVATGTPATADGSPFACNFDSVVIGKNAVIGRKVLADDEWGLRGHFVDSMMIGIYPGVQLLELAERLLNLSALSHARPPVGLASIHNFRFRSPIIPPTKLSLSLVSHGDLVKARAFNSAHEFGCGALGFIERHTNPSPMSSPMVIETMAQLVAIAGKRKHQCTGGIPILGKIINMSIRREIAQGEPFTPRVQSIALRQIGGMVSGKASVAAAWYPNGGDKPSVDFIEGELSFTLANRNAFLASLG